mgnify:CR=1 FL=1
MITLRLRPSLVNYSRERAHAFQRDVVRALEALPADGPLPAPAGPPTAATDHAVPTTAGSPGSTGPPGPGGAAGSGGSATRSAPTLQPLRVAPDRRRNIGDLTAKQRAFLRSRAHVLKPEDPMITYRVATSLDKMLRPREAEIQYRLFLHQLELERIDALGDAYAKIAEAMAYARERIVVLERRTP